MYDNLTKFFNGKTSVSQSVESIKDIPTFVICFSKPSSRIADYEYGSDIKFEYQITLKAGQTKSVFLKERENSTIFDEIIFLQKLITVYDSWYKTNERSCYKLTSVSMKYITKYRTNIYVRFIDLIKEHIPFSVYVYVSSEKNSYGIIHTKWKDGDYIKTDVNRGKLREIELKSDQHNYITSCSHESYYECLGRLTAKTLKGTSSNCSIISLPSFQVCKINKTEEEEDEFWKAYNNAQFDVCYANRFCTTMGYFGKEGGH